MLIFDKVENHKVSGPPVMRCRIKFETGKRVIDEKDTSITTQQAENLCEELMTLFAGGGLELFKERYGRIKKWGKDCLQRELHGRNVSTVPVTRKIGRNALCPCGSGRKYKHCCGR
jgi:uncharacterized protein YecA (UPF0149 family)